MAVRKVVDQMRLLAADRSSPCSRPASHETAPCVTRDQCESVMSRVMPVTSRVRSRLGEDSRLSPVKYSLHAARGGGVIFSPPERGTGRRGGRIWRRCRCEMFPRSGTHPGKCRLHQGCICPNAFLLICVRICHSASVPI